MTNKDFYSPDGRQGDVPPDDFTADLVARRSAGRHAGVEGFLTELAAIALSL